MKVEMYYGTQDQRFGTTSEGIVVVEIPDDTADSLIESVATETFHRDFKIDNVIFVCLHNRTQTRHKTDEEVKEIMQKILAICKVEGVSFYQDEFSGGYVVGNYSDNFAFLLTARFINNTN